MELISTFYLLISHPQVQQHTTNKLYSHNHAGMQSSPHLSHTERLKGVMRHGLRNKEEEIVSR